MFFEKINFDGVSVYKTNVADKISISSLYDVGRELKDFLPYKSIKTGKRPGYQILLPSSHSKSNILNDIYSLCVDSYTKVYNIQCTNWYCDSWYFISESTETESAYHTHKHMSSMTFEEVISAFSSVLYVSLPEVMNGVEGSLRFRTESGYEHDIQPTLGDLIWFPANLEHKPLTNPSSKTPRYTIATSYLIHKKKGKGSLI